MAQPTDYFLGSTIERGLLAEKELADWAWGRKPR
jgi:hypothetical protein